MEDNKEEIEKHFSELIKICKERGIIGMHTRVDDKFYVSFDFRPLKEVCKECGKAID